MKGVFITFEGPEGSGKSTQISRLAERLRKLGHDVLCTREPGGTATGEAIRNIVQHNTAGEPISPEAEALLFAASRAQLVRRVILPALLKKGSWVICDRFADSTVAYQGYGRELDVEKIIRINSFAINGAIPDVTFLLDVPVKRGFDRLSKRNRAGKTKRDRIERENIKFHEKVRAGYLKLAARWPKRFTVINAARDAERVEDDIWRVVKKMAILP